MAWRLDRGPPVSARRGLQVHERDPFASCRRRGVDGGPPVVLARRITARTPAWPYMMNQSNTQVKSAAVPPKAAQKKSDGKCPTSCQTPKKPGLRKTIVSAPDAHT